MRKPSLYEDPSCATVGGDFWFPEKVDGTSNSIEMAMAISICKQCTHQKECAEWGIAKERFGIWGGKTQLQLQAFRRERNIILKGEAVA